MAIDQRIILVSPLTVLARLTELVPTLDFWGAIGYSLVRITAGFLLGVAAGTCWRLCPPGSAGWRSCWRQPPGHQVHSGGLLYHSGADPVFLQESGGADLLPDRPAGPLYQSVERHPGRDPQLLEMARVFRVPALRGIRYVYLPQVLPYFRSACGSALGLCWKSGIAAEVIGMPDGPSANSSSRPKSI